MKIKIPCTTSDEEDKYKNEVALAEDADYEVEEEFKVANYKLEHVKNEYIDIFHTTEMGNANLLWSAINPKTIKSAIIGVTWKPVLFFLVFYYLFQILYQYEIFSTCKDIRNDVNGTEPTEPEAEAAVCNRAWHDWVAGMKESEATATKYLTFILGFYVGQMIKRWWDQVKSLPDIDSITNCLAGFVQLEFDDNQKAQDNALRLKKKVVRYCLLAWTMCLAAISPPLHQKFESGDKYIQKGLMRKGELKALQGDKPACWKDQWWIPITWAICLVNSNHPDSQGCKLKEQKDIISNLNKFHSKLHLVSLYQNNPLPLIYGQALILAIYSWIILGIFASQYLDIQHNASVVFFSIPWFQIVKIILIYAWMKVANIVRNPFGLDENYDINLEEMLDHNIWKASLSIRHLDKPIYTF